MGDVLSVWLSLLDSVLGSHVVALLWGSGVDVFEFDYGTFSLSFVFVAVSVWLVVLSVHVLADLFEADL